MRGEGKDMVPERPPCDHVWTGTVGSDLLEILSVTLKGKTWSQIQSRSPASRLQRRWSKQKLVIYLCQRKQVEVNPHVFLLLRRTR